MKKMSSELSFKNMPVEPVLPPDMDYVYFENAEKYPIKIKETAYSPVNAWWFSECSFLSYTHAGFARMAYLLAGFDNFESFCNEFINCMIVWNEQCIIVSFRGSELNNISALHNLISNLDTKPVSFDQGGKVHQGFSKALNKIWDKPIGVKIFLDHLIEENPNRNLWFTGHSLGGALAGLAFTKHPASFGLYTFGSPRFGDEEFITLSKNKPVWRIVNYNDPVPFLPPDLPKINFNFKHLGKLIYLRDDGQIVFDKEEFDLTDQTGIAKKIIARQFRRAGNITKRFIKQEKPSNIFSKINIFKKNIKIAYSRISKDIRLFFSNWKNYGKDLKTLTSININNHMPIYYCCKLWNTLIKTEDKNTS